MRRRISWLVVATTSEWLAKWHMGRVSLGAAMHDGVMRVSGPPHLVRALATLGISKFAAVEPASTAAGSQTATPPSPARRRAPTAAGGRRARRAPTSS